MSKDYRSWGYSPSKAQRAIRPTWRQFDWPEDTATYLAYGNGRSYGDSCLNSGGILIDSRSLNKVIDFDKEKGVLSCEAGLLLSDLLELVVPHGWFIPVTPGTSYVTLGGALANDVHGKNHHRDGCLGNHVLSFQLRRSNGTIYRCSDRENAAWYRTTIGGLGLTGFITTVELKLMPIQSSNLDVETMVFKGIEQFCRFSAESEASHQYVVAWLDCMASGKNFGRGVFLRANHGTATSDDVTNLSFSSKVLLSIPFNLPNWCLGRRSVRCFNTLYFFAKSKLSPRRSRKSLMSFFYPLDAVRNWNRIYGKRGFYQCQFVVPRDSIDDLEDILQTIVDSEQSSFLAVLKEFGGLSSPGLLSFPRAGLCLALDFPDRGAPTRQLLSAIEQKVLQAGGAIYPAKDRSMSALAFRQFYPKLDEFKPYVDPGMNSDFWSRVND